MINLAIPEIFHLVVQSQGLIISREHLNDHEVSLTILIDV